MKKVILSEEQIKRMIDKLVITEQQASEFAGSTDANSVSHTLLSKNFGLPEGNTHENFYYSANVVDVIKMSENSSSRSQFLSVFKPTTVYGNNPKIFMDYFDVNGDKIDDKGSKVFNFVKGTVTASHNGLLALVRSMDRMSGKSGKLTITFGRAKGGKNSEAERSSQGVTFDSNRSFDLSPFMRLIQDAFVQVSIYPQSRKYITADSFPGHSIDKIIERIPTWISQLITGQGGFMDTKRKDEILTNLQPKGYITNIDFDVNSIIEQLKPLSSQADMYANGNSNQDGTPKLEYNQNKRKALDKISSSYYNDFSNKIRDAYITNFKIYIENYLPNSKEQLLPLLKNVKLDVVTLGSEHYQDFNAKFFSGSSSNSSLSNSSGNYKTGN
jgi:hypothetical protein